MHCYHCASDAGANAAFCGKCGAPLGFTEDIIHAAIAKEEHAITYLYNETYNSVFQAIRPLIKDEDTALDILQDAYIKAFESLEQLEKPEQFRAWVKRIAQNKSKDWLKKKKPTLFSEMRPDDEDGEIDFLDDRELAQPDAILDKKETGRLLWEIIDTLSDEQRLVVSMFYFQEMQVKDIALELDTSENTVKSRLNYARKNIETKVLALEKKGTKLYSLAPLPFLLWLIRSGTEMPSAATLTEITCSLGATGSAAATSSSGAMATSAAAMSGTAATGATSAAAGASIVTKIIVGIVTAAIAIGGGALLYQALTPDDELTEVVSQIDETQGVTDVTTETEADVIPEPEPTPSPEPTPDLESLNVERIAAFVAYVESVAVDGLFHYAYKYILYDVDGDGLYELLATNHSDITLGSHVFAIDEVGELVPLYYAADSDGGGRAWTDFVHLEYQGKEYFAHSYTVSTYDMNAAYSYGTYSLLDTKDGELAVTYEIEYTITYKHEEESIPSTTAVIAGAPMDEGEFTAMRERTEIIPGMSRDDFINAYKTVEMIPDNWESVEPKAPIDYVGYHSPSYRIDAVGESVQVTYSVEMTEGVVTMPFTIHGTWTDNMLDMETLELNGKDFTGAFEDFDLVFYEDSVELTIKIKGAPAEGAPSNGTYMLTK